MTSRVLLLAFLACVLAQLGAAPAVADPDARAPGLYFGRADLRLCPSPLCGGIWLRPMNGTDPACAEDAGGECYVSGLSFRESAYGEERWQRLTELVVRGGGLVSGRRSPADVDGFPDLRALTVVSVWRPASRRSPRGPLWVLRDNGLRCVTRPCPSTRASAVGRSRYADVSAVDLSATGADSGEVRLARTRIATRRQLATGFVRGRGVGKVFVATQLYFAARR